MTSAAAHGGGIPPEADVVLRVRPFGRLRRSPHRVGMEEAARGHDEWAAR